MRFTNPFTRSKAPEPLGTASLGIYAIVDVAAGTIIGGLQVYRHAAAAVRVFNDIAAAEGTAINKHPEDYHMLYLGKLNDDFTIAGIKDPEVVISGRAWKAGQPLSIVKEA